MEEGAVALPENQKKSANETTTREVAQIRQGEGGGSSEIQA